MISKYQFPRDLSEEFKKIYFLAYETLNRDFGDMSASTAEKKNPGLLNTTDTVSNLKAIITLPMPEQFGDDLTHTWEKKDTLESLDAGASSATDAMIGVAALSSIFKSIQGIAAPLIGTLSLSKVVTGFLNAGKSPSVGLMSMFSGARKTLVNPDYWQNYTGSDPRTFEFKYVFQPRSREEATEVLNILRVFKMLSSPRLENVPNSGDFKKSVIQIFTGGNSNEAATGSEEIIDRKNAAEQIGDFGDQLSTFLEKKSGQSLQNLSNAQSFVGAIKQPHYWKIVLGNNHLNNLTKMTELVCNKVGISFGSSKMEVFSDGIPKIMELSLSFAEIKLKYENDFETPFTTNDKANSDEYRNIVEAHDNAVKAQQKEQAEQKAKEAEQKAKEQKEQEAKAAAEKEENEKRALAEKAQKKLEAWISGNSATAKGVKAGFGMMGSRFAADAKKLNDQENISWN